MSLAWIFFLPGLLEEYWTWWSWLSLEWGSARLCPLTVAKCILRRSYINICIWCFFSVLWLCILPMSNSQAANLRSRVCLWELGILAILKTPEWTDSVDAKSSSGLCFTFFHLCSKTPQVCSGDTYNWSFDSTLGSWSSLLGTAMT